MATNCAGELQRRKQHLCVISNYPSTISIAQISYAAPALIDKIMRLPISHPSPPPSASQSYTQRPPILKPTESHPSNPQPNSLPISFPIPVPLHEPLSPAQPPSSHPTQTPAIASLPLPRTVGFISTQRKKATLLISKMQDMGEGAARLTNAEFHLARPWQPAPETNPSKEFQK
jgi:hypothetical protein